MLQAILNIFKIPELRNKIIFTFAMLAVFRIGHWIPMPGVDQDQLSTLMGEALDEGSAAGRVAQFISIFSGGALDQSTIFALGVMPYISAGIIIQLFTTVSPRLKKLQEEGPTGRQKIQEWTRYLTLALCVVQGVGALQFVVAQRIVPPHVATPVWWIMAVTALTAGTAFLMWLGEQIDRHGIGNGVSMIIMAGILARMPGAIMRVYENFDPSNPDKMNYVSLAMLVGGFVLVVCGSVILTVAQRRIPIQQAKHVRGAKVFGGQKSYLPLRLNHGGVMPIVFASSLMIFPSVFFGALYSQVSAMAPDSFFSSAVNWLNDQFAVGAPLYVFFEVIMIYFFSYFWISVQFNPEEMSKQLRDHGSFIPGLRPGPRTAEYLETVVGRITLVGATFLAIIAVVPTLAQKAMNIDYSVTQFLGGTGLLICVSVILDFIQRVEANLLMRNYAGFLGSEGGTGPRVPGPR